MSSTTTWKWLNEPSCLSYKPRTATRKAAFLFPPWLVTAVSRTRFWLALGSGGLGRHFSTLRRRSRRRRGSYQRLAAARRHAPTRVATQPGAGSKGRLRDGSELH